MASKTTDPGLGAPDTARTHDTAVTDPMSAAGATTDPATHGDNTTPDAEPETAPERGDDLLGGLRRERPPPRLSPRIRAESEGAVAAAYYAGPQSLPARFDTPAPEDAVEIATTPAGPTTEPLARAVLPAGGPSPAIAALRKAGNEPTVPIRRKKRAPTGAIGAVVLIAVAGLALWFALRMGGDTQHDDTPASASARGAPGTSVAIAPSPPASAGPRVYEPASAAPASSPSPSAVRIETTASSARPNVHPPVSGASPSQTSAPPRETPHPPVAPAATPSVEPRPTPPSIAPSAKIDHVRTI